MPYQKEQSNQQDLECLRPDLRKKVSPRELKHMLASEKPIQHSLWEGFKNDLRKRGGEVWEWDNSENLPDGRISASSGWCIIRSGKIVNSICWIFT